MNKTIVSRPLLLEQLETRCLLAASVFEYSATLGSRSIGIYVAEMRSPSPAMVVGQSVRQGRPVQPRFDQHLAHQHHDSQGAPQLLSPQPNMDQQFNELLAIGSTSRPRVNLPFSSSTAVEIRSLIAITTRYRSDASGSV